MIGVVYHAEENGSKREKNKKNWANMAHGDSLYGLDSGSGRE